MRYDAGTSSGGQVSNTSDPIICIEFHARSTNGSSVYAGVSDVSSSNGREIPPGESYKLDFSPGSILFSQFYVSVSGGDLVDWSVLIR